MAQNITLLGASYASVPAVTLPKTGGGTASFTDVTDTTAAAADVASGKYFYTSAGVRTQGTSSGGGGGIGTLLNTTSMGTISTTSTQGSNTGVTLSVSGIDAYDALLVVASVGTAVQGRHVATAGFIFLNGTIEGGVSQTMSTGTVATAKWNTYWTTNGKYSAVHTTAYGIYPNSCSISSGVASIPMYRKYNSSYTTTINGSYTARVYGLKLRDLVY